MPRLSLSSASPAAVGFAAALGAFLFWAVVFPIYIKLVAHVGPMEVVAHRVIWTVVLMGGLILALRGPRAIAAAIGTWKRLGILAVTTLLVTTNWTVFIWAVIQGQLVECSIGYYMNPLVNVLLGVIFLRERLSRRQTAAVVLAGLGVLSLVVWQGSLPWVALVLPLSFGLYGLIRKATAIDSTIGLLVETALVAPVALAYLLWLGPQGSFGTVGAWTDVLLVLAGPMTFIPLGLFLIAGQRLKYSTIGLMQYMTPTGQLLLGVLAYGERFTPAHAIAFVCIWAALVLYSTEALAARRGERASATHRA
jgi:chloramphenicol-sensitive protein RarD